MELFLDFLPVWLYPLSHVQPSISKTMPLSPNIKLLKMKNLLPLDFGSEVSYSVELSFSERLEEVCLDVKS